MRLRVSILTSEPGRDAQYPRTSEGTPLCHRSTFAEFLDLGQVQKTDNRTSVCKTPYLLLVNQITSASRNWPQSQRQKSKSFSGESEYSHLQWAVVVCIAQGERNCLIRHRSRTCSGTWRHAWACPSLPALATIFCTSFSTAKQYRAESHDMDQWIPKAMKPAWIPLRVVGNDVWVLVYKVHLKSFSNWYIPTPAAVHVNARHVTCPNRRVILHVAMAS